MSEITRKERKPWVNWFLFILTVVVVFVIGLVTASIIERRQERAETLQPVTNIKKWEPRNEIWGENYPREYESYLKTLDTNFRSLHGGSGKIDYLENYPELVILWAGYAFSKEYNQGRGHAHAIEDIRNILRTGGVENSPQPATCWTCKSTDVPRLMATKGVPEFYKGKWKDKGDEVVNPIGCQDCHDPKSMKLRITRPALIEAFQRQGKKMEDFTHQDMRSLVCAQCHVEYYFRKSDNYLFFPWDSGMTVEAMEKYYDNIEFYDWKHALSRTPMLKAQHPDYEIYKMGVHARRGVSCADCHMPYKVEGGVKYSDHHLQSPLAAISTSCQVCHKESEQTLYEDVMERQNKVLELRRIAEITLARVHIEAKKAWDAGATEQEMKPILQLIRQSQWRWDWMAASNSFGFHAPVEAMRLMGNAISKAKEAHGLLEVVLTKKGVPVPIQMPDISTKAKAQKYIGLDMESFRKDKDVFLKKVIVQWDEKAKKRQGTLKKY